MSAIADTEKWTVSSSHDERWRKDGIELHIADAEARLEPADRERTECRDLYREQGEVHYRIQFYYGYHEQFGTGVHQYKDLGDCVLNLLCLQADHELSVRAT